tara:strand:+ start:131 stop:415 length:285 start_codon:yes stop_codon:yes gene_type:complete
MRYPKYLINAFAILGVASFIFLACSASETAMDNDGNNDGDNNPPIQNNYGKYQISSVYSASNGTDIIYYVFGLNTETGEAVRKTAFGDNILFTH